jgi:hypothetical protein
VGAQGIQGPQGPQGSAGSDADFDTTTPTNLDTLNRNQVFKFADHITGAPDVGYGYDAVGMHWEHSTQQTQIVSIGTSHKLMMRIKDGSSWSEWTHLDPIGVGQTWQSVSRSRGTIYQNLTGRPIMCQCRLTYTSGIVYIQISANGSSGWMEIGSVSGNNQTNTFIVPDGWSYRIYPSRSGTEILNWKELR